jgi:uncharacterized protein DUF433
MSSDPLRLITSDPTVLSGQAMIVGTRLPVSVVLDCLADGMVRCHPSRRDLGRWAAAGTACSTSGCPCGVGCIGSTSPSASWRWDAAAGSVHSTGGALGPSSADVLLLDRTHRTGQIGSQHT